MLNDYEECILKEIVLESEAILDILKKKDFKEDNPLYKSMKRIVGLSQKLMEKKP